MVSHSKYPWFVLDVFVFVLANAVLLGVFRNRLPGVFSISFLQVIILGLAVFRGADLIANEKITKPLRAPFVKEEQKEGKEVEVPKQKGFKGAMGDLLYCPSCMGVWVAMFLVYGYIFSPKVVGVIILILAISGLERIITTVYNFIKKKTVT